MQPSAPDPGAPQEAVAGADAPARAAVPQAYQSLLATAAGVKGSEYVPLRDEALTDAQALVKLIAFYLPQFHPIPENDAWWGRGFTEWTNVSKAVPQFAGHYQPHLPGELGFYDLRVPEVQQRQVELARHYGLAGFCFYYYWFGGTRLLERPLDQFMANPAIDFPFCVCWANENWTRRWDGHEDQILMAQDHGHESDAAFIADIAPILRHKNYIRLHGRPVVLVYRPMLLRDPVATAARWRDHCRQVGLPDPYLVATEAFDTVDPATIGFDAAVEFPPNTGGRALPGEITSDLALVNPAYAGAVYRYEDMWRGRLNSARPPYTRFRAVCPGFDNEPREPGNGSTYAFSSPASYGRWLEAACRATLAEPDPEKRLVFVNAWNEWAEGAHLEPDRRFGYAYLDTTAQVLQGLQRDWTMLVVSHDACRGGAQLVLLEYLAWLKQHTAVRLKVLCLAAGEWLPRFQELADTAVMSDLEAQARQAGDRDVTGQLLNFCGGSPALVYGNSVASGRAYATLHRLNAPIVTHVHELETSIARYAAEWFDDVLALSSHFIACSEPVRANLMATHGVAPRMVSTVHASIRPRRRRSGPRRTRARVTAHAAWACGRQADRHGLRPRNAVPQGRRPVHRGGAPPPAAGPTRPPPLLGRRLSSGRARCRARVWADHLARLKAADAPPVTFLGVQNDARPYLRAADVFLVTSREDPFPLVALEAAECGVPIVCFADAGGMPTFVEADAGIVVPFEDVDAMAAAVAALCADEPRRQALGAQGRRKVLSRFTTDFTAPHLLSVCRTVAGKAPAVSVIVPNYNHGRYLRQRLDSIFAQTFRDLEVIVLDDASSDDSLQVIADYRDRADVRVIENAQNSGSTFTQWLKGIDLARADVIWIAESDDGCEPDFIATLLPALRDPRVKLAFANSHVWDERSAVVGDYTSNPYLTSLSATKWAQAYRVSAEQEIERRPGGEEHDSERQCRDVPEGRDRRRDAAPARRDADCRRLALLRARPAWR